MQLTEDEKKLLQQQAIARKTDQSKTKRAKIRLTCEKSGLDGCTSRTNRGLFTRPRP
ncbi:hypothetical protein [aff. Roholtiella sp. LEGE 12411]|uniref:hypothetical protein n=1 Tax=aff. Roholtiella sp. LEGE 12411 TaxID=1828822 RepID=UPI001880CC6D|nr:hypothetical protein [aff. Roholtiella sp. LEGE 12411]MBE9037746.1 hypothetical protein [aff. Roholtiella sp. LEGE 12411]